MEKLTLNVNTVTVINWDYLFYSEIVKQRTSIWKKSKQCENNGNEIWMGSAKCFCLNQRQAAWTIHQRTESTKILKRERERERERERDLSQCYLNDWPRKNILFWHLNIWCITDHMFWSYFSICIFGPFRFSFKKSHLIAGFKTKITTLS